MELIHYATNKSKAFRNSEKGIIIKMGKVMGVEIKKNIEIGKTIAILAKHDHPCHQHEPLTRGGKEPVFEILNKKNFKESDLKYDGAIHKGYMTTIRSEKEKTISLKFTMLSSEEKGMGKKMEAYSTKGHGK